MFDGSFEKYLNAKLKLDEFLKCTSLLVYHEQFMSVAGNFEAFLWQLNIGSEMRSTISSRYLAICRRLNLDFWNMDTSGVEDMLFIWP